MSERPVPETSVPAEATPSVCPYCERPFSTDRQRALHVGEVHSDRSDERAAYERAREAEADELFVFHLKVLFALGAVYAAFVVASVVAFSVAG